MAWLKAKGITTPEELRTCLLELQIEPDSFPQDVLQEHLGSFCAILDEKTTVNMALVADDNLVNPVQQVQPKRLSKKSTVIS